MPFYSSCLFSDQLQGLFAQIIILVEGDTESFSLPIYFERAGFNLEANGIEIIKCQGKNNILKYYRFFTAYGYRCFCLFDADEGASGNKKNDEFISLFNIDSINVDDSCFSYGTSYGYFGKDFESYMRKNVNNYNDLEVKAREFLQTQSKPIIARYIANNNDITPKFINDILFVLGLKNEQA